MFEWSKSCEESLKLLKDRLIFALVLTLQEGIEGFVVYSNASRVDAACVFMQHGKVIAYDSRKLKPHENSYQTQDLDLVSVVFYLKF